MLIPLVYTDEPCRGRSEGPDGPVACAALGGLRQTPSRLQEDLLVSCTVAHNQHPHTLTSPPPPGHSSWLELLFSLHLSLHFIFSTALPSTTPPPPPPPTPPPFPLHSLTSSSGCNDSWLSACLCVDAARCLLQTAPNIFHELGKWRQLKNTLHTTCDPCR